MFQSQLLLIYIKRGHLFVAQFFLGHPVEDEAVDHETNLKSIIYEDHDDQMKDCVEVGLKEIDIKQLSKKIALK